MNAISDPLEALIREQVASILLPLGFRRRGAQFALRRGDDWGIIHIQRWFAGADSGALVTANLAVSSGRLATWLGDYKASMPSYLHCHWRMRIGECTPARSDTWWPMDVVGEIPASQVLDPMAARRGVDGFIEAVADYGVPCVMDHMDMARLVDAWADSGDRTAEGHNGALYAAVLVASGIRPHLAPQLIDRLSALRTSVGLSELALIDRAITDLRGSASVDPRRPTTTR